MVFSYPPPVSLDGLMLNLLSMYKTAECSLKTSLKWRLNGIKDATIVVEHGVVATPRAVGVKLMVLVG